MNVQPTMESRIARPHAWVSYTPLAILLVFVLGILARGLSASGIWDPWELDVLDSVQKWLSNRDWSFDRPPLTEWMIGLSLQLFGSLGWAARAPVVAGGLLTVIVTYALVRRIADARTGFYAALIAATNPWFLFNSRQVVGDSFSFFAQGIAGLLALELVFPTAFEEGNPDANAIRWPRIVAVGVALVGAAVLATLSTGVLLGVLPPLVAISMMGFSDLKRIRERGRPNLFGLFGVTAVTLAGSAIVIAEVFKDEAGYSFWLGGAPKGGNPPAFDRLLEILFHSFAPWSALIPVALGRAISNVFATSGDTFAARRLFLALWVAIGYGAHTLFSSRYGSAVFTPLVPLAGLVALTLRDFERSDAPFRLEAIVSFLFAVLLLRDYRLYPGSALSGLNLSNLAVPDTFKPGPFWTVTLALFGVAAAVTMGIDPKVESRGFATPYELIRKQWQRGISYKLWLGVFALLIGVMWFLGLLGIFNGLPVPVIVPWVVLASALASSAQTFAVFRQQRLGAPSLPIYKRSWFWFVLSALLWVITAALMVRLLTGFERLPTLFVRVTKALLVLPFAAVITVHAAQWFAVWIRKLGQIRMMPVLAMGVATAVYAAQGYLPALSAHFSPREVYDVYNSLAKPGEPLGEYRVGARAAKYYTRGKLTEIRTSAEAIQFLQGTSASPSGETARQRRWILFSTDEFAELNRQFRKHTGRHLFVADKRSARIMLAANQPLAGLPNQNPLAAYVQKKVPPIQFPVGARFGDKIVLLGYDLDLPHKTFVGAGESFTVTWYFQALQANPGNYKIFLHVDGHGLRLNGDHDPIEDKYPIRLWEQGDIIVDKQTLTVPANYRSGPYTMYIGLFSGESRMPVTEGPKDGENRVIAGTLHVR